MMTPVEYHPLSAHLETPLHVRDLMSVQPLYLYPEDTIDKAYDLMSFYGIRHIPVVDMHHHVHGIVSHQDIVQSILHIDFYHPDAGDRLDQTIKSTWVKEIMSPDPITISADAPAAEAAELMLSRRLSCLPVVIEDIHLAGMLTESDFVRYVYGMANADGDATA